MKIFLKESRPLSPLGEINATLSKIQLVLLTPTLVKLVVSIATRMYTFIIQKY